MSDENKTPFGLRCFPEKVAFEDTDGEPMTLEGLDSGEIRIDFPDRGIAGVEYYIDEFLVTILTKAHPDVRELVRVAREIVVTLSGNGLYSSARRLTAVLAPLVSSKTP